MLVVAQTVCVIPSRSKCCWLRGIVHARDRLAHAVALLRDLGDDEVVLVVARHSEEQLGRTCDACAFEDGDLRRVSPDHHRAELLLEPREAIGTLLDHRHLVSEVDERARDVRAHLSPTGDDDVHQASDSFGADARTVSSSPEIAVWVGQTMLIPRSA